MIFALIVIWLVARMFRYSFFYRPYGGFWGFPGLWGMGMRRPPMPPHMGGFGGRPPMGGFGGPGMGGRRF